jgi:hypothetical protein
MKKHAYIGNDVYFMCAKSQPKIRCIQLSTKKKIYYVSRYVNSTPSNFARFCLFV